MAGLGPPESHPEVSLISTTRKLRCPPGERERCVGIGLTLERMNQTPQVKIVIGRGHLEGRHSRGRIKTRLKGRNSKTERRVVVEIADGWGPVRGGGLAPPRPPATPGSSRVSIQVAQCSVDAILDSDGFTTILRT